MSNWSCRICYDEFERHVLLAKDNPTAARDLADLLESEPHDHKAMMLGCLADHDLVLTDDLLEVVTRLVYEQDRDVSRAAALALYSGGSESEQELADALDLMDDDKREDLAGLIRFAEGPTGLEPATDKELEILRSTN